VLTERAVGRSLSTARPDGASPRREKKRLLAAPVGLRADVRAQGPRLEARIARVNAQIAAVIAADPERAAMSGVRCNPVLRAF
jgi:hypothetical protein